MVNESSPGPQRCQETGREPTFNCHNHVFCGLQINSIPAHLMLVVANGSVRATWPLMLTHFLLHAEPLQEAQDGFCPWQKGHKTCRPRSGRLRRLMVDFARMAGSICSLVWSPESGEGNWVGFAYSFKRTERLPQTRLRRPD